MGAPAGALSVLEVAVGGGGAALAGLEPVGVHGQAHGAARLPPLEPGVEQDVVETLRLRLELYDPRSRNHQRAHAGRDAAALGDAGDLADVLDRPLVQEPTNTTSTGVSSSR